MEVTREGHRVQRYWDVDLSPDAVDWSRPEASWSEELRSTLDEACRIRLRADVTVGTYLSGGLDSSIITTLSKRNHQPDLMTFSLAFRDAGYDESAFQQLVADQIGTEHHTVSVSRELIAERFRLAIWHTETPMHRTAPIPLMELSALVRSTGLKVVLSGEGADEVFGGYDQFRENKIRRFWARVPTSAWRKRLLDRLEPNIARSGPRTRAFWYAFYQEGLQATGRPAYSHYPRWRNGASLLPLICAGDTRTSGPSWIEHVEATAPDGFASWDPLSQAQYWEIRQFLAGYLLSSQGDRVAMANSVEGRYPFLDANVFALSRRIPPRLKMRVLQEKYLLKRTFQSDLPPAIVERKKYPYRAPDALALYRGALRRQLLDSLNPEAVQRRGLFHPEGIRKLLERVDRTEDPSARDNMALVLVYSAHTFHEQFIEGRMETSALPPLNTDVDLTHITNQVERAS
jgi:asparagine synthase (glutamine-hydrolysing)